MAIKLKVNEDQKELDKKYEEAVASGDANAKKEKASFKHEMIKSRTLIEKLRKVIFIISCVCLLITFNLMIAPAATGLFGFALGVIWFFIVVASTCCTAGLIWAAGAFRTFERGLLNVVRNIFDGTIDKMTEVLKKVLPFAIPICLAFIIASFVFSTICFAKNKKGNTALFVINLIFLILALVFTIVSLVNTYTK